MKIISFSELIPVIQDHITVSWNIVSFIWREAVWMFNEYYHVLKYGLNCKIVPAS